MKRTIISALFLLTVTAMAVAGPLPASRGGQPITVKSNELSADSRNRTATFSGKVTARQGDLTIYSDRLIVHYRDDGGDVEKVEAVGNVKIVQGNRLATAKEGVYYNTEQKIVLSGDPKVYQGENMISGKVITYFVNEERSVVTGGGDSRVEAVIHPTDKGKNGGTKR